MKTLSANSATTLSQKANRIKKRTNLQTMIKKTEVVKKSKKLPLNSSKF